jgi:hypothetical protein
MIETRLRRLSRWFMRSCRTLLLLAATLLPACSSAANSAESGKDLDAWIVLDGSHEEHMSGSVTDAERVRTLAGGKPVLWARRADHEWLIRDSKLIARARALLAPIGELGRQQGELGKQQGQLGKQMGTLGKQQGALGKQMGALSDDPEHNQARMDELSKQMDQLGRQMDQLGAQMNQLGVQLDKRGHKIESMTRAVEHQLAELVDQARAAHLAESVR